MMSLSVSITKRPPRMMARNSVCVAIDMAANSYAVLALMLPTKSGFPSAQAGMSFIETPFLSFDFAGRFGRRG